MNSHYPIKYYYERACSISWICCCGCHNKHHPLAQGTVYTFTCVMDKKESEKEKGMKDAIIDQ